MWCGLGSRSREHKFPVCLRWLCLVGWEFPSLVFGGLCWWTILFEQGTNSIGTGPVPLALALHQLYARVLRHAQKKLAQLLHSPGPSYNKCRLPSSHLCAVYAVHRLIPNCLHTHGRTRRHTDSQSCKSHHSPFTINPGSGTLHTRLA